MTPRLFALQLLNGVDYGLLLFLVAGGLTLVFGVLGVLNFAHGSFYMLGAYLAYWLSARTGSFLVAILVGVPAMAAFGIAVEKLAIAPLYKRDHLSQVLLTYGFVLLLNDLQRALFGTEVHGVAAPEALSFRIPLGGGQTWPAYRLFVALVCVAVAATIRQAILKTRFGMRVRAGASNLEMVEALGVDVRKLFTGLFAAGTGLAGFAGMLGAPLTTVYPGMGEGVLVRSLVVVVIGGVGSLKGAFVGALLVGAADTFGRVLIPSFSSAIVYAAMAAVLVFRPQGLFGSPG